PIPSRAARSFHARGVRRRLLGRRVCPVRGARLARDALRLHLTTLSPPRTTTPRPQKTSLPPCEQRAPPPLLAARTHQDPAVRHGRVHEGAAFGVEYSGDDRTAGVGHGAS